VFGLLYLIEKEITRDSCMAGLGGYEIAFPTEASNKLKRHNA
jgi:hypothetical protein